MIISWSFIVSLILFKNLLMKFSFIIIIIINYYYY